MDRSNSFVCLKMTLISVNLFGIVAGIIGFVTGLAHPDILIDSDVSGAQLALASVIMILISLIGLIGSYKHSYYLLLIYGIFIFISFTFRIFWSASSYWHGETFFLDASAASTLISAILYLLVMIFAFLFAHAIRIRNHERMNDDYKHENEA